MGVMTAQSAVDVSRIVSMIPVLITEMTLGATAVIFASVKMLLITAGSNDSK